MLGVRAVIDESYERLHRSNLIGMGVLPLQYAEGEIADSIGLTGEEEVAIAGVEAINDGTTPRPVTESPGTSSSRPDRGSTRPWQDYFRHGRIISMSLKPARLTAPVKSGMRSR